MLLEADNGDWDDEDSVFHLCLGKGVCALPGCDGTEKTAKHLTVTAIEVVVGDVTEPPLKYRWKGMEKSSCDSYRSIRLHNFQKTTLCCLFPKAEVRSAEAMVEHAVVAGEDDNVQVARQKQKVRGGSVRAFFEQADAVDHVEYSIMLHSGEFSVSSVVYSRRKRLSPNTLSFFR